VVELRLKYFSASFAFILFLVDIVYWENIVTSLQYGSGNISVTVLS